MKSSSLMERKSALIVTVIIGKLIPAGSGLAAYRKFDEIEDEVHDDNRFRDVAAAAADSREDDENPVLEIEEDDEDEVLSIAIEGEDELAVSATTEE